MKSLNEVRLIGNVCKDPEIKAMQSGNKVASFSLATNHSYTNKAGEKIDEPDFHNIVAFNKVAEIIEQYVKKGQPLYIAGRIKNRSWQDDQGVKKYRTEIVVDNLIMLSQKSKTDEVLNTQLAKSVKAEMPDFPEVF